MANLTDTLVVQFFESSWKEEGILIFCGTISAIGFLVSLFFDPKLDIKRLDKIG